MSAEILVHLFYSGLCALLGAVTLTTFNCILLYSYGVTLEEIGQTYLSKILTAVARRPDLIPETLRSHFNDLPIPTLRRATMHTHAESAADRSGASSFADLFGPTLGLVPYFIQRSRADERNSRLGSRVLYWTKDLTAEPQQMHPPSDALLVIVDVDQYIDMPAFLTSHFKPTLLYTFQPHAVARNCGEYSFTFNHENEVDYRVVGGGHYKHKVWNYGTDHIMIASYTLGLCVGTAAYLVDRRKTASDHELILLTPVMQWKFPFTYLSLRLEGNRLRRLSVVHGDFTRLLLHQSGGMMTSTGRPGALICATIPSHIDDMLAGVAQLSKLELTKAQVASYVDGDDEKAIILTQYHRQKVGAKPDVVYPVPESIRRYQFEPKSYDPEAKPSLTPFMSPIVHGCFAPDVCKHNDKQAVKGRVEDIRSNTAITPFLIKVMTEFAEFLIPEPHKLAPMPMEVVWERQDRPTQRRILEEASLMGPAYSAIVKPFIKKEAYATPNDPRLITIICGVDKMQYSRYTYALSDVFKTQKWYAFGRSPRSTAERVAQICSEAKSHAALGDFSRMDGRVSPAFRYLELLVIMRAFTRKVHQDLQKVHRSQSHQVAITSNGVKYYTGETRFSGSPETSLFNTLGDVFATYLAFRLDDERGHHYSPLEAWNKLGMYGGDDSITADLDPKLATKAALMIGQVLKIESVPRGNPGVNFLARYYGPYVWFGDAVSCCDLKRQLSKFHTTVSLGCSITPEMKLLEKCMSFYTTDRNSPIIGHLVTAIIELVGYENLMSTPSIRGTQTQRDEMVPLRRWQDDVCLDDQYPNERADWMVELLDTQMPGFDVERFVRWLEVATETTFANILNWSQKMRSGECKRILTGDLAFTASLTPFLSPPLCLEIRPPIVHTGAVVVEGEILKQPGEDANKLIKLEGIPMKKPNGRGRGGAPMRGVGPRGRGTTITRGRGKRSQPSSKSEQVDTTKTCSTKS
jgi:hypothetical protein